MIKDVHCFWNLSQCNEKQKNEMIESNWEVMQGEEGEERKSQI